MVSAALFMMERGSSNMAVQTNAFNLWMSEQINVNGPMLHGIKAWIDGSVQHQVSFFSQINTETPCQTIQTAYDQIPWGYRVAAIFGRSHIH